MSKEPGALHLVPADAPRPERAARFKLKALPLRSFGTYVRQAEAKHAYAVFDACFAGTVFDSQRALPPVAITRATTLPVRQFLTSGDAGQAVSDDGTFRELFIRALRGEERADANGDGYVTASEIGLFLGARVTNLTRARQTPRYGKLRDKGYDRGDFVFAVAKAGAAVRALVRSEPAAVEEMDLDMVATRTANVRAGPSTSDGKVTTLPRGSRVAVTGRAGAWYRVALASGGVGYVFGALLEERAEAAPPPAAAPRDPWRIVLDSGITLGDWVLLAEDRLKQGRARRSGGGGGPPPAALRRPTAGGRDPAGGGPRRRARPQGAG